MTILPKREADTLAHLVEQELETERCSEYEESLHWLFELARGFEYNSPRHRIPEMC